jgi:hypothetical protein
MIHVEPCGSSPFLHFREVHMKEDCIIDRGKLLEKDCVIDRGNPVDSVLRKRT